ncbi:hypothetical protein M8J77_010778, partial [Diaphorina citri]
EKMLFILCCSQEYLGDKLPASPHEWGQENPAERDSPEGANVFNVLSSITYPTSD